jgi:hypothetical protein
MHIIQLSMVPSLTLIGTRSAVLEVARQGQALGPSFLVLCRTPALFTSLQ